MPERHAGLFHLGLLQSKSLLFQLSRPRVNIWDLPQSSRWFRVPFAQELHLTGGRRVDDALRRPACIRILFSLLSRAAAFDKGRELPQVSMVIRLILVTTVTEPFP